MQKFSVETESWGAWTLKKDFSSLDRALRFGRECFPQNEWRVFDRIAGAVVYTHDPMGAIQQEAAADIERFNETQRWRQIFAERRAQDVVAEQQRERMAQIAARQRQRAREVDAQRRARLRGFGFVGARPQIMYEDEWSDFLEPKRRDRAEEKVNWLKEGF